PINQLERESYGHRIVVQEIWTNGSTCERHGGVTATLAKTAHHSPCQTREESATPQEQGDSQTSRAVTRTPRSQSLTTALELHINERRCRVWHSMDEYYC